MPDARVVEWIIPDRPISVDEELLPKFLDDSLLSTPSIALENVAREMMEFLNKGEGSRDGFKVRSFSLTEDV